MSSALAAKHNLYLLETRYTEDYTIKPPLSDGLNGSVSAADFLYLLQAE